MSKSQQIFVFGASGHAKVVLDIVEREGRAKVAAVVDDDPARAGQMLLGYRVAGGRDELLGRGANAGLVIVAIGTNAARRSVAAWLASQGFAFASAIHPAAQIGREVRIGAGTVVMAGAAINPDTEIGMHCIVNTGASVDHDCRIADGAHVAPGARLCGGVSVGTGVFIGAGAVIVPGRRIGADAIIAAGAVVLKDVPERAVVAGNPARPLNEHEPHCNSD
jgi:sugar O-acyltransferase (sialic acid O-acetyltransferase NeuD family)